MARCILMTGGGGGVMSEDTTVAAEDVLEGKTYLGSDTDDEIGVGTMPNNDSFSSTLNCGQSILIPRGYHTGSGKITANSLASQTPGNATAASILKGRTGWVNGKEITGTMTNVAATEKMKSYTVSGGNLYLRMTNGAHITNASSGYPEIYIPQANVASAFGLTSNKIAYGNTIMGITGNAVTSIENSSSIKKVIYANGKFGDGFSLNNIEFSGPGEYGTAIKRNEETFIRLRSKMFNSDWYWPDKMKEGSWWQTGFVIRITKAVDLTNINYVELSISGIKNGVINGSGDDFLSKLCVDKSLSDISLWDVHTTNRNGNNFSYGDGVCTRDSAVGRVFTVALDVSNKTGNYYIGFGPNTGGEGNGTDDSGKYRDNHGNRNNKDEVDDYYECWIHSLVLK